ncbi:MAG TPA: hypothetical protein IGS52_00985 [Oscillatoriaceae cyanobacterium M33_DOE_052]|uniref:Uncharacterized protein n=1 Tax=Planktothricoides sp. SpSt-374 TaxID=2282167 RepID=A0A7C3VM95_9CYAN|nr:hypothetical protein [Oscillatoriaceae cyanobacterium M33_DOE_052]
MPTVTNIWILLAVAIAVAVVAGSMVTMTTFTAIGAFFYGYSTLPLAVSLGSSLFIIGAGALPLARTLKGKPILAVVIAVVGAAAAVGAIAIAGTAITGFFSGNEKDIVKGIIAIGIAIIYAGLAIGGLVFTFNIIRNAGGSGG